MDLAAEQAEEAAEIARDPASSQVCSSCGNVFERDSVFCRKCGKKRAGAGEPELPPVAEDPAAVAAVENEEGARSISRGSFLFLDVCLFFGGHLLDGYCLLLFILMPLKGFWFWYPSGWHVTEIILLVLCFVLQRLQRVCGNYGNRAQSAPPLAAFLALTGPLIFLVGYFAGLQVYVLHLEFFLGVMSLLLLLGQFVLGSGAGLLVSEKTSEIVLMVIAAIVAFGAVVMVLILIFRTEVSEQASDTSFGFGIAIISTGIILAAIAGCLCLDLG